MNVLCWICRTKRANPHARLDSTGHAWCQDCIDEHDNIDWGERAELRMENGGF
jgi:hypothetical protein